MSQQTRERILYAAGEIFAEKGFHAATVREICAAAGTNQAAINYYFRDKENLYLEVVRLAHTLRMRQTPPAEWPAELAPTEKLRIFVRTTLKRMLETPDVQWPLRLMMREMLEPTVASQSLVEEFIRPQLQQLLSVLDELLPVSTPEYRRYQYAFSLIGQCLHYRVAEKFVSLLISPEELSAHFGIEQLVNHITEFTLAALREISRSHSGEPTPPEQETRASTAADNSRRTPERALKNSSVPSEASQASQRKVRKRELRKEEIKISAERETEDSPKPASDANLR